MNESENLSRWAVLSALADGEADATGAATASARWRDDAALRERWHSYQLIGDVLRSDELAGRGGDADFLRRLRVQLEREPVVLAPATVPAVPAPARAKLLRRWGAPAAVAAGFVMVAGALTITRLPQQQATPLQAQMAAAVPVTPAPVLAVPAAPVLAEARPQRVESASGVLLRDARLDQYLLAHKEFGGSSALGASSGFLRSATFEGATPLAGSR